MVHVEPVWCFQGLGEKCMNWNFFEKTELQVHLRAITVAFSS